MGQAWWGRRGRAGIIIVAVVRKDLVKAGRERERKGEKGHEDTSIKGKPVTSGSE